MAQTWKAILTLYLPRSVPPLTDNQFNQLEQYLLTQQGASQVSQWVDNIGYEVTFPSQQAYSGFEDTTASVLSFLATNFPIQGSPWALILSSNFALLNAGFIILFRFDGSTDPSGQVLVNLLEDFDGGYSHAGIMANQTDVFQVSPARNLGYANMLDLATFALSYPGSIWAFPLTGINPASLSDQIQQMITDNARYDGYAQFGDDLTKLFLRMAEVVAIGKLYEKVEPENQYICSSLVAQVLINSNVIDDTHVRNWYVPVNLTGGLPLQDGITEGNAIQLVCQQNTYPITLPAPRPPAARVTFETQAVPAPRWNFL
eukprot:TRINITY_DN634_c0_g1_i1.p1 TRINITY_DN634_c0_g1~~TRINITY_DN634_c0_g1_i1.p1  ORF type:complete len:316 (-),score=45.05 TRINITY_DN634_c0_g1_i1:94-1041(-)